MAKALSIGVEGSTLLRKYIHGGMSCRLKCLQANLKYQPIIVAGDGHVDSPAFSEKNCTYTLMHSELDFFSPF